MLGLLAIGWTLACTGPFPARADGDPATSALDRVRFEVERTRPVAHDRITATVGVTDEDSESARLADRINETMAWALGKARTAPAVEAKTGSYQTHPVHEDGRIRRWRGSQDLILSSGDVPALTALVGELQSRLLIRQVSFGVSPEQRRRVQDELISEALSAYEQRAQRIQQALSARGYRLIEMTIETPDSQAPIARFSRAQVFSAEVTPPAFEAGETELGVRIHATIELER
jgi:predicted secreted protein